ncbi:MAG TPA: aminotransferase class III-fold pyridoxal phosphate-dependent enzyme [Thermoanaerobaculia bacterium]|nr:aminotransferase class III-fold pyridoxal phosphate-dependent enzyme [Thermoanaerobaculia bacterium]
MSLALADDEISALLPVYDQLPLEPISGAGVWLETAGGRRVLDLYGGHAVALLGYRHPDLLAALEGQARQLFFQSNAVPLAVRERAAAKLSAFAPPGLGPVFFVNSGAEANENALRIALRATGRRAVVALEGAFHGRTAGAGAVTWNARWYGFPRAPFDVRFVPREDPDALARELARGDVAAVVLEPVQGVAGAIALSDAYLHAARRLTREHGALLVFDEVQCGMGRSGQPFVAQAAGVAPDLLTTAKGLAGGFPAGALLLTPRLAAGVSPGDLGSTFGGGPMACALIEATIDAFAGGSLLANVRARAEQIRATCGVGPVEAIGGRGLLVGLRTSRPARSVQRELLERGILTGTSADPQVLRLLPPLVLEAAHVELLAAALAELPA